MSTKQFCFMQNYLKTSSFFYNIFFLTCGRVDRFGCATRYCVRVSSINCAIYPALIPGPFCRSNEESILTYKKHCFPKKKALSSFGGGISAAECNVTSSCRGKWEEGEERCSSKTKEGPSSLSSSAGRMKTAERRSVEEEDC